MSTEYADCANVAIPIARSKSELSSKTAFSNPFRIQPVYTLNFDPLLNVLMPIAQSMIEKMIPESYLLAIKSDNSIQAIKNVFYQLSRQIPIFKYFTFESEKGGGIHLQMICHAKFTCGIGRYLTDTFTRWLVPGTRLENISGMGQNFQFVLFPAQQFYFRQETFLFSHPNDLLTALRTVPRLIEELRMNILAVYHARYLASMKSISLEERNRLIQQNIASLFKLPDRATDLNAFDQMHHFLIKLTEEEKIVEVKRNIHHLMRNRPQNFDRDIFYEMTSFTAHFQGPFTTVRDPRHISRIIAFHYLFKKSLLQSIQNTPHERHLNIKLLKAQMTRNEPVLGILIGMNLLRETERFDRKHLLSAIHNCLPTAHAVTDSFIMDRREEKVRIYYLEIYNLNHIPFSLHEVRHLQQKLPELLKRQIENVVHPIFMPRNEEDVLRNIVILSKQIKYLRDLPHLTIHYEKQTDTEISFLIVLVRLLKEKDLPFKELLKSCGSTLRILVDEIRSAGSKRRYPKEAVVFRAILDKSPFFRKDYSLDLKRARQRVGVELRQFLGEFRDFNGGMIHKQDEALEQLRKVIGPSAAHHEVLLENYFYSLRPGIMQTVHGAEMLRILFKLLLEVLDEDLTQKGFSLKVAGDGKYFFAMIGAAAPTFKEEVLTAVARLKIASYDLTSTFLHVQEYATLGYILRTDDLERRSQLQQTLLEAMLKWKINFSCQVKCEQ